MKDWICYPAITDPNKNDLLVLIVIAYAQDLFLLKIGIYSGYVDIVLTPYLYTLYFDISLTFCKHLTTLILST